MTGKPGAKPNSRISFPKILGISGNSVLSLLSRKLFRVIDI